VEDHVNTIRTLKIGLAWTSIVWTVCYLVVGLIPGLGPGLLPYLFHLNLGSVENIFTIGNFIGGLVLWNVIVAAGIALAGVLSNSIK
jgi:hypothetical protein